jgi:molybdate/tungstate transport system substrate-binding protein
MKRHASTKTRAATSILFLCASMLVTSCGHDSRNQASGTGQLIVFNAGSLAAPIADLLSEFARLHPNIQPKQESSGSLEAARKVTDLGKPCDILAVADYEVIPSLLMPRHADWYVVFARNQLVLIYTPRSKFSDEIDHDNWFEVLQRPGVQYGYSNPDLDPAGYRTLLHWQLAEKYYGRPGLSQRLRSGVPPKNIRPKSVELVALLQSGELDYIYCYRSIAEQYQLPFVRFPSEIDFGDASKSDYYAMASVDVAGNKPGEKLHIKGMPIRYGLTIPADAPDRDVAKQFTEFMLSPRGQEIMQQKHLLTISPPLASEPDKLPTGLKTKVAPMSAS